MIERAFQISPEELPEKEVWFAMGYRGSVPEQRIRDMVLEIRDDPEKRARAFKYGWIIAYSMLLLGAFLIVWAFLV